jgi:hypothetical protein
MKKWQTKSAVLLTSLLMGRTLFSSSASAKNIVFLDVKSSLSNGIGIDKF